MVRNMNQTETWHMACVEKNMKTGEDWKEVIIRNTRNHTV